MVNGSPTFRGVDFGFVKPKPPRSHAVTATRALRVRATARLTNKDAGLPALPLPLTRRSTQATRARGVIYRFVCDPVVHDSVSSAGIFNDLRSSSSLPCANASTPACQLTVKGSRDLKLEMQRTAAQTESLNPCRPRVALNKARDGPRMRCAGIYSKPEITLTTRDSSWPQLT